MGRGCFGSLMPPFQPATLTGQGPFEGLRCSPGQRGHVCSQSDLLAVGSLAKHAPHRQHLSRPSSGPGPRYTLTNHHTKNHHTPTTVTLTPPKYTQNYILYTNQLKVQKHTHNSMYMAGYTSSQTSVLQSTSCATVMITRSIGRTHTVTRHSREHPYRPSTETGSTAGYRGLSCTETEVCLPISDLARSRAPVAQRDKLEREHGATGGGEARPGVEMGGSPCSGSVLQSLLSQHSGPGPYHTLMWHHDQPLPSAAASAQVPSRACMTQEAG